MITVFEADDKLRAGVTLLQGRLLGRGLRIKLLQSMALQAMLSRIQFTCLINKVASHFRLA